MEWLERDLKRAIAPWRNLNIVQMSPAMDHGRQVRSRRRGRFRNIHFGTAVRLASPLSSCRMIGHGRWRERSRRGRGESGDLGTQGTPLRRVDTGHTMGWLCHTNMDLLHQLRRPQKAGGMQGAWANQHAASWLCSSRSLPKVCRGRP